MFSRRFEGSASGVIVRRISRWVARLVTGTLSAQIFKSGEIRMGDLMSRCCCCWRWSSSGVYRAVLENCVMSTIGMYRKVKEVAIWK